MNGQWSTIVAVTVTEADDRRSTEKLILRALIISLLIHFFAFFLYKVGQNQGWWANWTSPRWMQIVSRALTPTIIKNVAVVTPRQVPLVFVETDPADAVAEPPKKPKFEGAHNTIAANKEIVKPSDMPNISGRQTKVLKTTPQALPKTEAAKPTPPPKPQTEVTVAHQQKTYTPGDLAMARPNEKAQQSETQAEAQNPTELQPQPLPQPVHHRPRTLAEAREQDGTLGQQAKLTGGVPNVKLTGSSLDVKGTVWGNYEQVMVDAISKQWHLSLENIPWNASGKVIVDFKLYPDGRVDQVNITQNEVTEELALFCSGAIIKPSPFGSWPREMRLDIPADFLELQFTFYYDVE